MKTVLTLNPLLRCLEGRSTQGRNLLAEQRKVARQAASVMISIAAITAGFYLILHLIESPLGKASSAGFIFSGAGFGIYSSLRCLRIVQTSTWTRFWCWCLIVCVAALLAGLSAMLEAYTPTGSVVIFLLAALLGSALMCVLFGAGLARTDTIEQQWFPRNDFRCFFKPDCLGGLLLLHQERLDRGAGSFLSRLLLGALLGSLDSPGRVCLF